jgi:hypothetical protein
LALHKCGKNNNLERLPGSVRARAALAATCRINAAGSGVTVLAVPIAQIAYQKSGCGANRTTNERTTDVIGNDGSSYRANPGTGRHVAFGGRTPRHRSNDGKNCDCFLHIDLPQLTPDE